MNQYEREVSLSYQDDRHGVSLSLHVEALGVVLTGQVNGVDVRLHVMGAKLSAGSLGEIEISRRDTPLVMQTWSPRTNLRQENPDIETSATALYKRLREMPEPLPFE